MNKPKFVDTELIQTGKFLELYKDKFFNKTGDVIYWERCSRKNNVKAVMIVPYHIKRNKFVLIHEYRYPIKRMELGFPAGLIEPTELIETTIKRELKEETGLDLVEIKQISPLTYSSSGMTDEACAIAHVTVDGVISTQNQESSENIMPVFASKYDLADLLNEPQIAWGSKAWLICNNIVNPIIFK